MREKLIELMELARTQCINMHCEDCECYSKEKKCLLHKYADQILADEEIKHAFELLKAEKEGRLLETPCKVGDIVLLSYLFENQWRLEPITVCALIYDKSGFVIKGIDCGSNIWVLREDRIGKDVFLHYEDAEKALEERRDK